MRRALVALALAVVLRVSPVFADDVLHASDRLATTGHFEEAAASLEQHAASQTPGTADAARVRAWLERALEIRIALGDHAHALGDAQALARWSADRDRAAEAELESATVLTRTQRWGDSVRFHQGWLRRYARAAVALRTRALVELGDAQREQGDAQQAAASYQRAIAAAGTQTTVDTTLAEWLARARFWQSERAYQAYVARSTPRFVGEGRRAWDRWATRVITPFFLGQRATMEALQRRYVEVIRLDVPRWTVAAAHHIAAINDRFGEHIGTRLVPPDIADNPDLLDWYLSNRCEGPNPPDPRATGITGFHACVSVATRLREFNQYARDCEAQLHDADPRRFPIGDELIPTADQGRWPTHPRQRPQTAPARPSTTP